MTKPLPLKRGPGVKRTPHADGECPKCRKGRLTATGEQRASLGIAHEVYECSRASCDYTELRPE